MCSLGRLAETRTALSTVFDNVKQHLDDLFGSAGGMPAQVDDLPTATGRPKISVLVERFVDGPEVEPPTVPLNREADRREGKVETRNNVSLVVDERELWHEFRKARIIDDPPDDFLQP